jgi:hypothetical protein
LKSNFEAERNKEEFELDKMFSFYNSLYDLKQKDLKFKQNFKYSIVHPIKNYSEKTPIEEMDLITVNLEMCTLYKGVPYGLALI